MLPTGLSSGVGQGFKPRLPFLPPIHGPWSFHECSIFNQCYYILLPSNPIPSFPFHCSTVLSCPVPFYPIPCSILPYTLFHSTLYPVPFYPPVSLYPNLLFSILIVLLILRCFFSSYSVPSHHTLFLLILHCSFSSYIVPSHPTVQ